MSVAAATGQAADFIARLITGAQGVHWKDCPPLPEQRIYFANHQSHFDIVLIWAAFRTSCVPRPAPSRRARLLGQERLSDLADECRLQRDLRQPHARQPEEDPLEPLVEALGHGDSWSSFPGHALAHTGTRWRSSRPLPPGRAVSARAPGAHLDRQRPARDAQRARSCLCPSCAPSPLASPISLQPGESKADFWCAPARPCWRSGPTGMG